MSYIITGTQKGPYAVAKRPTQQDFMSFGVGEYVLRRGDGAVAKFLNVVLNRNGNLKMEASDPEGIDALSTIVLNRLVRAYAPIVKHLPKSASARECKKVVDEVQARAALVASVDPQGKLAIEPTTKKVRTVKSVLTEGVGEPEAEVTEMTDDDLERLGETLKTTKRVALAGTAS